MDEEWRPGSFTKNFSWGGEDRGLKELHNLIRIGFGNSDADVPRSLFRERVKTSGRPDYIPLNFFLYNTIRSGTDFVIADELVFQAINFRHSAQFDRLALFAFHLSRVGTWKGAAAHQAQPALWAKHYLIDRVSKKYGWSTKNVSADDIEKFVIDDARYKAKTARKLATNLNYLYKQGKLSDYRSRKPERWWLNALFLTLDRACSDIVATGSIPKDGNLLEYAVRYGFNEIAGPRSLEKDISEIHFVKLYEACGGMSRFSEQAVFERQKILLPDIRHFANNPEPVGVFHPSNPYARGAIPRACAMLAHYIAGFEWMDIEGLESFDVEDFVKSRTKQALAELRARSIRSNISADELLKLTRGE